MGSAGGGYTRQALAMGYNDKQADLFGAIMGSMEGATEAVGGALTANVGKKFASKGLQAGLGALGLDVTENFLEEAIMEPIQELTKQSIGKNGDWKDITKRMLRSGLDGALTSIIMGGVSAGVGSAVKVATKAQNNEVISQEEIKQALQDINKSEEVDIEKLLVDSFNFQAQDLMQVTEAQQRKDDRLEKVAQDISQAEGLKIRYANLDDDRISQIENSELSENQINKLLDISNKYDLSQKDIQDLIDNTKNGKYEQNQATTTQNNEILNQEQQTIQQEGKQAQNQLSSQIGEKEQKALNLRQSIDNYNNSRAEGQKIFDINNEETRKEIESIQKVVEDRNINIRFDENRFKDNSQNAFYEYDENGNVANIILNPNSTTKKYVENLAIHELVHSFSGDKKANLMKEVVNYTKTLEGYDKAYQDIKSNYEKVYGKNVSEDVINEEVVANILGEKLGSKEFVNDLVNGKYSTQNRNFVQKIYDFVKNQINRFKGYKNQEQYWTHIKELFDDAYRNSEVSQEGLKQSVETNNKTSTTDSQGRELSKGQQEYNKDSKTRDKNGNLIPFYHGTYSDFNVFDKEKINSSGAGAYEGFGFNFTPSKTRAETYSNGKVKEVYLNITNPLSFNEKTITLEQLANIIETIDPTGDNVISNYAQETRDYGQPSFVKREALNTAKAIYEYSDSDADIYSQISSSGAEPKSTIKAFEDLGYDGVLHYDENGNIKTAITFEPNQAKNTNNLNPTENEDLRFSQETQDAWNNFIEKYFKNEGTGTAIKDMKKLPEMSITKYQEVLDNAKYIPQEDKQNLLSYLNDIKKNKSSLDDFKKIVNDLNNTYKQDNVLDTTETYSTGRKEKYQKYLNSKTDYDNSALKNAMDIIPANNQGRRTKEQWLNVAKQIGTEIADKSNQEIEEIAFRTWQDERPSSKESLNRQGQKFVQFNSDDWVNAIYNSVNEQREKFSIDTEQQVEQPVEQTVNYTEKEPVLKYNISDTIETKNKKQTDERVAEILTEPLTQQKPENRKWAILKANLFDKGIVFEDLSKKTKNRELESKWDYSLTSESRAQNAIGNTRYEFEDGKKKQVSKALLDIKEEVGNKTADFQNYMYHLLNIDRMSLQDRFGIENKPVFRKQY